MRPVVDVVLGVNDATVRTTQRSQAVVIAMLDHLATRPGSDAPRPLGRWWRMQLDATGLLVDEPLQLLDHVYDTGGRLLALHREFLHRMVEAMDTREAAPSGVGCADVVPLHHYR